MSHKVLMMGGQRSGKSTMLASIVHSQKRETSDSLFTIRDVTDYTQTIIGNDGQSYPLPALPSKIMEVSCYMRTHSNNSTFLVDTTKTYGKRSYILRLDSGLTSIDLEFVDVPSEWMRRDVKEFNQLKELVMTSDVFVIVIDTPFLMEEDKDVNAVYNRVQEITDAISEIIINQEVEADRRQIILCPVKCEKWIRLGQADLVSQKVNHAYKDLINRWILCPNVYIWITPIQTVGGIESVQQRSGFRSNGSGFKPVYCEQLVFHILRFLVEKEDNVFKQKTEILQSIAKQDRGSLWCYLSRVFKPTFGKYLPVWSDLINEIKNSGLLKEQGDGFEHIKMAINIEL